MTDSAASDRPEVVEVVTDSIPATAAHGEGRPGYCLCGRWADQCFGLAVARNIAAELARLKAQRTKGTMMATTTTLRPHAGFEVTVTRLDGVTYPAHLSRFDGPHGGIAVLYVEPVNCPADMQPYEQQIYVEALSEGCEVYRLSYTDEQEQRVRDFARQALDAT